jgi:predicted dehydrogenase|tara:strand:+ start:2978 stop:3967 length:990 start_codon:yes stop_codon:yes gene_type:complete
MSLKVGLIGCANTALKNFLPSIEFSDAKLEFIASRSSTKAKDWAERFQSTKFGNYEEVIESDVDMVYIPLPIGLHEEWIIKAAKSGKHILCEKSSTTSFESAKRIIDVCRENNVRILEAFSYKFHPQHEHVKELIKNEIGIVQNFVGRFGFAPPPIENIRWNKKLGGGILNDAACYPISACRMLLEQEPLSVFAELFFDKEFEVDTKANIFLKFFDGKTAFISSSFNSYYQSRYEVLGDKGKISTNRAYAVPKNYVVSTYFEKDDKVFEKKFVDVNQFGLMLKEFCDVITKKKENSFDFENDLLNQAKMMEAIRISSEQSREVFLSEFN